MRRSKPGQRNKVQQARAIVAQALGDAAWRDGPQAAPQYVPTTKSVESQVKSESIGVLTIGEAATRLGISTSEMEAIVRRGTVMSLMAGWTVVVPSNEVETLRKALGR